MTPTSFPASLFRLLLLTLLLALTACGSDSGGPSTPPGTETPSPQPDYWPTSGWQTAEPESHGFVTGAFDTLADAAAAALPYYTSLLVIKDGYLVHESYHDTDNVTGVNQDTQHHVWSITKSVTSLTMGRARTLHDINDLDIRIGDIFTDTAIGNLPNDDVRRDITLRHALQMRSGQSWHESAWLLQDFTKDPLFYADPTCATAPDRLLCAILQRPSVYEPGTTWNYSTYDTYLVSGFFKEITGKQLSEYANDNLFGLLGIDGSHVSWPALTPLGSTYTFGGGLLNIRSRDLAKLGMLVLYDGQWDGQQLVSQEWLDMSLTPQGSGKLAAFDEDSGEPITAVGGDIRYGLQWWLTSTPDMSGDDIIAAIGLHGQVMAIDKENRLIVVMTSADATDESEARNRYNDISGFIKTHIIDKLAP